MTTSQAGGFQVEVNSWCLGDLLAEILKPPPRITREFNRRPALKKIVKESGHKHPQVITYRIPNDTYRQP
jgi:hypothetical protein